VNRAQCPATPTAWSRSALFGSTTTRCSSEAGLVRSKNGRVALLRGLVSRFPSQGKAALPLVYIVILIWRYCSKIVSGDLAISRGFCKSLGPNTRANTSRSKFFELSRDGEIERGPVLLSKLQVPPADLLDMWVPLTHGPQQETAFTHADLLHPQCDVAQLRGRCPGQRRRRGG
jgi:hypothetical protein